MQKLHPNAVAVKPQLDGNSTKNSDAALHLDEDSTENFDVGIHGKPLTQRGSQNFGEYVQLEVTCTAAAARLLAMLRAGYLQVALLCLLLLIYTHTSLMGTKGIDTRTHSCSHILSIILAIRHHVEFRPRLLILCVHCLCDVGSHPSIHTGVCTCLFSVNNCSVLTILVSID